MSERLAYKTTLQDINGSRVYPDTLAVAVHVTPTQSLDAKLNEVDANIGTVNTAVTSVQNQLTALKYAESPEHGGSAVSANKLNTNAGDSGTPVYFAGGVPESCGFNVYEQVVTSHTNTNIELKSGYVMFGKKNVATIAFIDTFGGITYLKQDAQLVITRQDPEGIGTHTYEFKNDSGDSQEIFIIRTMA